MTDIEQSNNKGKYVMAYMPVYVPENMVNLIKKQPEAPLAAT